MFYEPLSRSETVKFRVTLNRQGVERHANCAKLNFCTLEFTAKKDGKVTMSGHIIVSPDGKSRTVTMSGSDPNGNQINTTELYDKQ